MPAFYPEGDEPKLADPSGRSLHKINNLLKSIDAKTGSTTITGPVTVSNEVEVTNSTGNPIPVSGTVTANTGLTQPLTDAQLRATAVPVNVSLIVNQGSLFLYSTTGTYGTFDCGADADYVVFNRTGGGGGFSQKLEFSSTSDFATIYDTVSGQIGCFTERFITNNGDVTAQEQNSEINTNNYGSYVVNLRRLSTYGGNENLKVRYVRVVVSGGGGGLFAGKFTSFRSKISGAFNTTAAPHRTLISGTVDINSAKRPLPVTDNGESLTVDGTVTVNDMTSGNAKTKVVDSAGADVSYITAGTAGTPSPNVLTVQGISGGTAIGINSDHVGDGIQYYLDNYGNNIPIYDASTANIDVDLGAKADAAATTDTGTFSVIALIKRSLQNWTSLLAKIPALVSGRIPVDGSGVTQPVSGTITAAQATAANLNATVVGSGSFTAAQATAANLNATVVQGTATNLKTQAEVYQGGSAVGSSNQLFVKTNTTYGGNAPIVVPGFYQSGLNNYLGVSDGSGLPIRPANSTTFAVTGTFWQATQPVSGTFWQATQPVSGTVTINNSQGATVTQSTFTSTTASTSLVAASANRKTLTVFNEGAGMLYVSVGSTCTTTAYQVRLSSGDYWECPPNQTSLAHTAVFATAGNARVTEVV